MTGRPRATAFIVAALLAACGGDASGPHGGDPGPGDPGTGELTARITDPTGDAFGSGAVRWDLTTMTVTRDTAGVTVVLEFSDDVISPTSGDTNAMIGFVDLDTDQDASTGIVSIVDEFRLDPDSTGLRADFRLALAGYEIDSSVPVSSAAGVETGRVKPVFGGRQVRVRLPKVLLGDDDGFLNAAAIVGTQARPNDIIPESGHLQVGGATPAASSRPRATVVAGAESRLVTERMRWMQH